MADYEFVQPPLFLPLLGKPYHDPALAPYHYPILATTLANFATDRAEPRPGHKDWLRGTVGRLLNSRPGSWVYLRGRASALGDPGHNLDLSERRKQQVAAVIQSVAPNLKKCDGVAKGEDARFVQKNDNSGCFRSVEMMVYGPEVPMPPQIVLKLPRLVYRETVEDKTYTQSNLPKEIDFEVPAVNGPGFFAVNERAKQHPCEAGDLDFGDVKSTQFVDLDSSFVLISVKIDRVYKEYPYRYEGLLTQTIYPKTITRRYSFVYGPGQWGRKVIVYRNEIHIDPEGRVSGGMRAPIHVDQPPSYQDP